MQTKLIVDVSSVLGAFMHLRDEEFGEDITHGGKVFHIPDLKTCKDRAEGSFQKTLNDLGINPADIIMVRDQEGTGAARKLIYPEYKGKREDRPKQFYTVLNALVEHMCDLVMTSGGVVATARVVPAVEADDLINELATRLEKTIIWTRDKDLLSCPATHHYIEGEIDPVKFPVPQHLIRLYRTLVTGDTSDNIPSCKQFGDAAWDKMLELIGWEGVDELDKMVQERRLHELKEDVPAFKKFQLLIDQAEQIYMIYHQLISFMSVPAHKVKWEARIETDVTKALVTADNFDAVLAQVKAELKTADHAVIDYETDVGPEARAWLQGTFDEETGKQAVMVDVIGSEICGMGLKLNNMCWYFSVDHLDTENISLEQLSQIIDLIKGMRVYAHNSTGFENVVTYNHFGVFMEDIMDTKIMASYVDEAAPLGLKPCSKRWLQYEQETYGQTLDKAQELRPDVVVEGMRQVSGETVLAYGIDDCLTCDALQNLFTAIMLYEKTYDVCIEVEQKSALVTSLAFIHGVPFNQEAWTKLKTENDARTLEYTKKVEDKLLSMGWGDNVFKPFVMMTAPTAKALFNLVTGTELETKARSMMGMKDAIRESGADAGLIEDMLTALEEGIDGVNELAKAYWKPTATINTRSPKQVASLLYDTLGCAVRIRNPVTEKGMAEYRKAVLDAPKNPQPGTPTVKIERPQGSPATSDAAFKNAIAWKDTNEEGVQLLKDIQEWKKCLTRESLFLRKYPSLKHWKTGNLHCSMNQSATTTRRFSHSAPNLAQMPKKQGIEVRDLLKAEDEWLIAAFDFASQELKLQAWDSKCPSFMACYTGPPETRKDVHAATGFYINLKSDTPAAVEEGFFNGLVKKEDKAAKAFRSKGKTVNFATAYGCKAKKLSQELCSSEEEATQFMEAKNEAFPGLQPHVDAFIELCKERRYSLTFLGARRHLAKEFAAKSDGDLASAGRLAWSFRIQGSAAEQSKLAMARLWNCGAFADGLLRFITLVHDELVVMIHKSVLEERIGVVHSCVVAQYADMELEAESSPDVGDSFGSLKSYKLS